MKGEVFVVSFRTLLLLGYAMTNIFEVKGEYVLVKRMACLDCWIEAVGFRLWDSPLCFLVTVKEKDPTPYLFRCCLWPTGFETP